MAKQSSLIKVRGTLDDLTFSKSKNGHLVREKSKTATAEEIATENRYSRMRENMDEFERAIEAARLLRVTFDPCMLFCRDKTLLKRSTQIMQQVLLSDPVSRRGDRNVMNGNIVLLKEFLLNSNAKFSSIFSGLFSTTIDRSEGKLIVDFTPFVPANTVKSQSGSTHFMLYTAAAEINFDTGAYTMKLAESPWIANKDGVPTAALTLVNQLMPGSTNPLFIAVGIRFSQEVNGEQYPFYNSSYNALDIADAASA